MTGAGWATRAGEDSGQLRHDGGEVGRGVAGRRVEVDVHDVEATLDQAAQIGEGHLCLLALGAHRPDLLDGPLLDPVEVVARNEAAEVVAVARHQGRSYSAGQGAALLRPAGA